jgi:hypothetical protein
LLKVAELATPEASLGLVREILTRRATAYLVPDEANKVVLWAGSTTDAAARRLRPISRSRGRR